MERDTDRLSLGLKWSVILHILVLATFSIKSAFFEENLTPYRPTLRVDVVDLPDVLKKDLSKVRKKEASPAPEKPKETKKETKTEEPKKELKKKVPPKEMVLAKKAQKSKKTKAKRKKKMESALERLKALEELDEEENEEILAPDIIKGNILSKGTSLAGDAKESPEMSYYDEVLEKIRENWSLPIWLARQDLSAQVLIFIDSDGRIRGSNFKKRSGNSRFDEIVEETLNKTELPPPPEDFQQQVGREGILLGFPL